MPLDTQDRIESSVKERWYEVEQVTVLTNVVYYRAANKGEAMERARHIDTPEMMRPVEWGGDIRCRLSTMRRVSDEDVEMEAEPYA